MSKVKLFIFGLICGGCFGAGSIIYFEYYDSSGSYVRLANVQQSLESVRTNSDRLTSELTRTKNLARASTVSINNAIEKIGRVTDANQRAIILISTIRTVANDLYEISENDQP